MRYSESVAKNFSLLYNPWCSKQRIKVVTDERRYTMVGYDKFKKILYHISLVNPCTQVNYTYTSDVQ